MICPIIYLAVKVSQGAISNMLKRSHHPFAIKKDDIIQVLRRAEMVASDETGIRIEGVNGYHWEFICYLAFVHEIQISLAKQVVLDMMGKHIPKLFLSDGYAAWARTWGASSNLSCSSGQRYRLWGGGEHRHAAGALEGMDGKSLPFGA